MANCKFSHITMIQDLKKHLKILLKESCQDDVSIRCSIYKFGRGIKNDYDEDNEILRAQRPLAQYKS